LAYPAPSASADGDVASHGGVYGARSHPPLASGRSQFSDFDEAERVSSSREELVQKMLAAHGARGNVYTLWAAATAVFRARDEQSST
jgi:hypothetical protein